MARIYFSSRIVKGTRDEKIRVRADFRDWQHVVRLDVLEPIARHDQAMMLIGRPVFISTEQVGAVCDALKAACAEARAADLGRGDDWPA